MSNNKRRRLIDRCPTFIRVILRWATWSGCIVLSVGFAVALFYFFLSLDFDMDQVAEMPERTLILDSDGQEMMSLHGVNRRPVTYEDLPPMLVKSLLAREDSRFFEHPGVDGLGVLRAIKRNVVDRSFSEGASTISMQLARNSFELREMNLHRKLLEVAVTLRIENKYEKEEILANYFNRIYFGSGCYGVQEASLTYFNLPVSELNEGECAMLAGIIRGPHIFSPFRNLEAAMEQRDQVIARLKAEGICDPAEAERIENLPIRLVPVGERSSERSYALQWIRGELQKLVNEKEIEDGGLIVKTTIDSSAQRELEEKISTQLFELEKLESWNHPKRSAGDKDGYLQCAAIKVEAKTGAVRVVVGGRNPEESFFNRASLARRDMGKAFAPLVNAAASERDKLVIKGVTVATGRQIGPDEVARIAKRMGIDSSRRDDDLFRGSVACTPKEFTGALATLASGGNKPDLHTIVEISNRSGEILYQRKPEGKTVINGRAASAGLGYPPFSKEGERQVMAEYSFSKRDLWVAEVLPEKEVMLMWFGFDSPKPIGLPKILKKKVRKISK